VKLVSWICLICCLLFATAHRLPAPIVEEEKPTPTPASAQTAKEKKSSIKSKATPQPKQASRATPEQKASVKQKRFAGTWVGTIPAFPTGPQETRLTIDPSETIMHHEWVGHPPENDARAEIIGDTLRAAFHEAIPFTFSLTPLGNGMTAQVRLQAFMNDQTAIFHRVAPPSPAR
jgi:hypothetical protein